MKRLTATLCLTIAVLLGSAGVSWSADLQKGLDAYNKKDYATALREWKPLAEQGDAVAASSGERVVEYASLLCPHLNPAQRYFFWVQELTV